MAVLCDECGDNCGGSYIYCDRCYTALQEKVERLEKEKEDAESDAEEFQKELELLSDRRK